MNIRCHLFVRDLFWQWTLSVLLSSLHEFFSSFFFLVGMHHFCCCQSLSLFFFLLGIAGRSRGLDWTELSQKLNPNFDWEGAIQDVLGMDISLSLVCFLN